MPLLSIIVPIYNTAERLEPCLESLLAQTIGDFELILVDDGSTDRSAEICRSYCARDPERIRFFTGPNRGVSAARNRGLDAARGEWVAFCDSDDRTDPELYRYLHGRAVAEGAELSCCALRHFLREGVEILTDLPCSGEEVLKERGEIQRRFFLPLLLNRRTCNGYLVICLFRRDLIERGGVRFIEGLSMKEDELFLLEYLLGVGRIAVSDRPLYDYLYFPDSLCATHYFRRNDFFRERNWFMRARAQRDIFLRSGLSGGRPELLPGFWLREFYHETQMICCDESLSAAQRRSSLKGVAARACREDAGAPDGFSGRLFRFALFHCRPLLPLLCRLKRLREVQERRGPVVRDTLLQYGEVCGSAPVPELAPPADASRKEGGDKCRS